MRLAVCVALVAAMATILWQAIQITSSAAAYPMSIAGSALLCSGLLLVSRFTGAPDHTGSSEIPRLSRLQLVRLISFAAVWIAYVVLLPRLGFMLSSWMALSLSLAITRGRPGMSAIGGTAVFVLLFAVLIKVVLYVPMPQGWLDEQLEIVLYRVL
jgi:hypothetical protein